MTCDMCMCVAQLVSDLRQRGVPLDGVGLQLHIDHRFARLPQLVDTMQRLATLGLQVHLTEVEVVVPEGGGSMRQMEDLWLQAEVYAVVLHACLTQPACSGFVSWGFTDSHAWHLSLIHISEPTRRS
eukprot:3871339-Prymnesium_polylepis.2